MRKISLVTPTRGRPHWLERMWTSALTTADNQDAIEIVLICDDDDQSVKETHRRACDIGGSVELLQVPRGTLSNYWNQGTELAHASIYMQASDDIIFRSQSWDTLVLEAFAACPDNLIFVHGRDGYQDQRLGTHGWLHRDWMDEVGYLVPPYFSSDYGDTWLTEVADRINRRVYLPDIFTEHMHFDIGKGPMDQTHKEREERGRIDQVSQIFNRLAPQRIEDARKLEEAISRLARA